MPDGARKGESLSTSHLVTRGLQLLQRKSKSVLSGSFGSATSAASTSRRYIVGMQNAPCTAGIVFAKFAKSAERASLRIIDCVECVRTPETLRAEAPARGRGPRRGTSRRRVVDASTKAAAKRGRRKRHTT